MTYTKSNVLWQALTLWLVNWRLAVRRGGPVEQVCNRKETTWYENHAVRFWDAVQSKWRIEPGIGSRSDALGRLWRYGFQEGASFGTPWLQEEGMRQEEVPSLRICLSCYLSNLQQTVNPFRE